MALIECSECGRQVSDKAESCPGCGAPVVAATAAVDSEANTDAAPSGWRIRRGDDEYLAASMESLREWARDGRLQRTDEVLSPGADEWIAAAELKEVADIYKAQTLTTSSTETPRKSYRPMATLTAKGRNGQLTLLDGRIRISRKGVLGLMTQGLKGDKEIQITSISSIQWKKAGAVVNGYIQFAFMGGQEAKGGMFQGATDENTVVFTKKQQPRFEAIRDEVQRLMNAPAQASAVPHPPTAGPLDRIKQLAELRDAGAISHEEFEAKKAELLARI